MSWWRQRRWLGRVPPGGVSGDQRVSSGSELITAPKRRSHLETETQTFGSENRYWRLCARGVETEMRRRVTRGVKSGFTFRTTPIPLCSLRAVDQSHRSFGWTRVSSSCGELKKGKTLKCVFIFSQYYEKVLTHWTVSSAPTFHRFYQMKNKKSFNEMT